MSERHRTIRWLTLALLTALWSSVPADAIAQLTLTRFTVDGGGVTRASGGTYALGGTIGQPDAGRLSGGAFNLLGGFWAGGIAVTGVEDGDDADRPLAFRMYPASPNPFMARTRIAFELPRAAATRVALYDAAGRLVRVIAEGPMAAGSHSQTWDRRDQSGRAVSPGIYFLRLDAGRDRSGQKLVVIH